MSIFIDRAFLHRVSPRLARFTQKKEDLYNFRCPLCGDSQKNKTKCRGFIYRKNNNYFYMCHNCGASINFYNFLEKVDPTLIKEYSLERYKNSDTGSQNYTKPDFEPVKSKPIFKEKINLETIGQLPDDHFAKQYVINRKIPKERWNDLYFTPDYMAFVDSLGVTKEGLKENDARLVIPFYNKEKELIAVQGRALGESKMRYVTVKIKDEDVKLYGIDQVDEGKTIYVTEGPIDSLFLENAVATADSNLTAASKVLDKTKLVLVFDNEPRNKEICKLLDKAIENHFQVVIWPPMVDGLKDINDMVLDGFDLEDIKDFIENHTFVNLRAKAEFVNWKKI
jgi:transcription elongation factor Elf1